MPCPLRMQLIPLLSSLSFPFLFPRVKCIVLATALRAVPVRLSRLRDSSGRCGLTGASAHVRGPQRLQPGFLLAAQKGGFSQYESDTVGPAVMGPSSMKIPSCCELFPRSIVRSAAQRSNLAAVTSVACELEM